MSAAGAVAAKRGRIMRAFANAGAFDETSAKSLDELGLRYFARGLFSRLEYRGVIIKSAGEKYYMDKNYYDAMIQRRKIMLPIALVAALIAVVCLFVFTR